MTLLAGSQKYRIALAIAFLSLVAILGSQPSPREQVGPLPGGAFLLNSGWRAGPRGPPDPARHPAHVHRPHARRQISARTQRRLPAALDQRDRNRVRPRHGQRAGAPTAGSVSPSRPRATRSTWAAAPKPRSSNSASPTVSSTPRVPSPWCRRRSAATRISSATSPSRPMADCSMPPTLPGHASWWSIRNPAW